MDENPYKSPEAGNEPAMGHPAKRRMAAAKRGALMGALIGAFTILSIVAIVVAFWLASHFLGWAFFG